MHLEIQREELLKAARHAQRFCGNVRTNPVLGSVLVRANAESIEVAATDLSKSVRHRIHPDRAKCKEPGSILVPADRLVGLLNSTTENSVTLKAAPGSDKVELKAGKGKFQILGEDPADFPTLPSFPTNVDLVVSPGRHLVEMGQKCAVATTKDEQRFSFDAICLIVSGSTIQGVSTDGRRLVSVTVNAAAKTAFAGRKLVVPDLLAQFGRLGPADDPIELAFGERHVFLRNGLAEVAAVDREGKFPPIEKIFMKRPEFTIAVGRDALQQALQQVGFVLDDQDNSVHLVLEPEMLVVQGRSARGGEGRAEVPSEGTSPVGFEVEFNPDLLVDFLKVMQDDRIEIGFRGPTEQVLLREPVSGVDYIVMPIKKEDQGGGERPGGGDSA